MNNIKNSKGIKKLARENFKANKKRNIIAILAIILTTVLFTTLFTVGISIKKTTEYSTMRMVGSTYHGTIKNLKLEQFNKIKENKLIDNYGVNVYLGKANNTELLKRNFEIRWGDNKDIEKSFSSPITGNMPTEKNEILVDKIFLEMMGLSNEIGQEVTISYDLNGENINEKFIISGVYEGEIVAKASTIYVSQKYIEDVLKNIDQDKLKENKSLVGLINLDINFSSELKIEDKLQKLIVEAGYNFDEIEYGVNWAFSSTSTEKDFGSIIGIIGFILLIMSSGYLIIYNVFYISIVKDIRFYGLLKTIGTTKKQIGNIIRRESLQLSIVGVPLGLIIGYFIGVVIMPIVGGMMDSKYIETSANPVIFIVSAVFAIITLFISNLKPIKIAATVSPIEAMKYTGVESKSKKVKKSKKGAKINRMALANIFRDKIKTIIVIASLAISMILLNAVYSLISGFDMDKYLINSIASDFTIESTVTMDNSDNGITGDVESTLENNQNIEELRKIYYRQDYEKINNKAMEYLNKKVKELDGGVKTAVSISIENQELINTFFGIDNELGKILEKYIIEGKFEEEKFKSGRYVVVEKNIVIGSIYKVGDKIELEDKNGEIREYTVMAVVEELPEYLRVDMSNIELTIYMNSTELKENFENTKLIRGLFDVKEGSNNKVEELLKEIIKENKTLDYKAKSILEDGFKGMVKTYETVGYGLSLILGLIGVLNFFNVIVTNILSRRREFAMLRSIGMTKKQINKMVTLEGFYYGAVTSIVVLILGTPLIYLGVNLFAQGLDYFTYKFTILPLIICIPILFLVFMLLPKCILKKINKESIIEGIK